MTGPTFETDFAFEDAVLVRTATEADLDVLLELMAEFHREGGGYVLDRTDARAAFVGLMADPAWGGIWLALRGTAALGHAVLSMRCGMEHGGRVGVVDDFFVRPPFRRPGVARALLGRLVADCHRRACRAIEVEPEPDNAPDRAAYAAAGFRRRADERTVMVAAPLPGRAFGPAPSRTSAISGAANNA